nr:carbohydrate binding family 9 domain-containing protein [bacterium]
MSKSAILVVTVISITTLLAFVSAENVALCLQQTPTSPPKKSERRQIVAARVKTPPKIDGILNGSVWEEAQPSQGFIQSKPDMGEPMTQQTAITIIYDDENIYVGIQCYDSEPEKVTGTEMRRDHEGVWDFNDYVRFVLDTHHDLRSAYYFGTNPLGAQVDARITNNGGNFHQNWDAVWDCAATRHSQGWSAEFSIPFRQLRYPNKEKHIWGFNCARSIQRSSEWGCWSSIEMKTISSISSAGELVGLEDIPRSRGLEIRPTAVSGAEVNYSSETDVDSIKKPSIDVK